MTRHGQTSKGRQRWRCRSCQATQVGRIDATAKHLQEFLAWLLSNRRQAVVLIAQTPTRVLGWYVARNENSRAWGALMSRIAAPDMVVCDAGSGFERARRTYWPTSQVQRCTFHALGITKKATTTHPKLEVSRQLYWLGRGLVRIQDLDAAVQWLKDDNRWRNQWDGFLAKAHHLAYRGMELRPPAPARCPRRTTRSRAARTRHYDRCYAPTEA